MEPIRLSNRLVGEILETLRRHEPACDDSLIASQYLAAVIGYFLASHPAAAAEKDQILDEMSDFLRHVYTDLSHSQAPPQDPQQAVGVWEPPK